MDEKLWAVVDAETGAVKGGAPFDGSSWEEAAFEVIGTLLLPETLQVMFEKALSEAGLRLVPLTPELEAAYLVDDDHPESPLLTDHPLS